MQLGTSLSLTRAGVPANAYALGQAALARGDAIMAAPNPDVTFGTPVPEATVSGITSPVRVYAWDRVAGTLNANLRCLGSIAGQADPNAPRRDYARSLSSTLTYAPGTQTGPECSYLTNYTGTALDILVRNGGSNSTSEYFVFVDDKYVASITSASVIATGVSVGSLVRIPITFSTRAMRTIRIIAHSFSCEFAGFDTEPSATLAKPSVSAKRVLFVGDSFTEGSNSGSSFCYTEWMYPMTGAQNVWKCGSGGTGYVADGPRTSLSDRYQNDIVALAPDVCVVFMGLNDVSLYASDPAGFRTSVESMYDDLIAQLPGTKFVVFGPWSPRGGIYTQGGLAPMDADLQSIASARGLSFVSPIQGQWITGNGNVSAPTGNGNSDQYISSDGTHPTPEGHKYLAWRIAGELRKIGAIQP